ncbi:MAG: DUF2336 domain-containing protein [Proteobacteria bacterium]|nr:DUF2336 domain-containing protein [Pseudomonadota bacterium]
MSRLKNRLAGGNIGETMPNYDEAKKLAATASALDRNALAARPDTPPEILYFLADDANVAVRRTVAANSATPPHAGIILASDDDDQVRCHVAQQIGRLAPGLDKEARDRIGAVVNQVLEKLAQDQVTRVRRMLAEELKDAENVPAAVIRRLANDADAAVAGPVLEFSPVLDDEILLEIIQGSPETAAISAISRRKLLGAAVSDAVVATQDHQAIAALLSNKSAQIREETLDQLVEQAEQVPQWHQPLVDRPALSARAVTRLAEFVADKLLAELERREDLDPETAKTVSAALKQRLRDDWLADDPDDSVPLSEMDRDEPADERVRRLIAEGALSEAEITDALGKGDRGFVIAALAQLGGISIDMVNKAVSMSSSKGITAMAWKAGFGMRTAVQLQLRLARVPPTKALQARNGTDYPLSEEEMRWQIDFFGT